jgi:retron-type reverse transcriptase
MGDGFPPNPNSNCGAVQFALTVPAIRDRVVQGALKLILEPIFVALGKFGRGGTDDELAKPLDPA